MNAIGKTFIPSVSLLFLAGAFAMAQPYEIPWHTIDGGGTLSAGGDYTLSATIGQHDASNASTGGNYELRGGFWQILISCACLGDMNSDGRKDGMDIQQFAMCVTSGGSCACADVDGINGVTLADTAVFVNDLLAANLCP